MPLIDSERNALRDVNVYQIANGEKVSAVIDSVEGYKEIVYQDKSQISDINGDNKFTLNCAPCVGVIAYGFSAETGEPVTGLSHIDASFILDEGLSDRIKLRTQFFQLRQIADPRYLAVGIAGGIVMPDRPPNYFSYPALVAAIGKIAMDTLKREPRVLQGPKSFSPFSFSHLFVDTRRNLAAVVEDKQPFPQISKPFVASDIALRVEEWGRLGYRLDKERFSVSI